jgi:hypothetical protein
MLEGKIWGYYWKDSTCKEKKVADFLKGSTAISANVVKDYFRLKEFEKKQEGKLDIILQKVESYDQKLGNLSDIIKDLYVSVLKLSKSLSADPFVGLKEISEAFKLNGKSLYTQKTLRNKIKIEKFGNVIIGYLDILNLHIVMMKKGKYWITPLVHWENERRKIDYDYLVKLRFKHKNVYDQKFKNKKDENK